MEENRYITDMDYRIQSFVLSSNELVSNMKDFNHHIFALVNGAKIVLKNEENVIVVSGGRIQAEIEIAGKSRPVIICTDRARVKIMTGGTSSPNISIRKNAELRARTLGASEAVFEAVGNARLLITCKESSRPRIRTLDFSVPMIIVQDQAKPKCADWPEEWEAYKFDIYIGQRLVRFKTREEAIAAVHAFYSEWRQCHNRYIACMRTPGAIPKICPGVVNFRWPDGTVHLELANEGNPRSWYSPDLPVSRPITEAERETCERFYLE